MCLINTVKGPVEPDELGNVLSHEHVFVLSPEIHQNFPHEWGDEDRRVDDAVETLRALKSSGIDTIIDPTVLGLGRYIPRIQRIAHRIDLNIVVATGAYIFNDLPMYFKMRPAATADVDVLSKRFVKEITEGIAGTNVKAGVIKCATDWPGLTPDVERTLRASSHAHRETGCPITTHTRAQGRTGLLQQQVFRSAGVDLTRTVIGHCGDTDDMDYLHELIDGGSMLGMDRFGLDGFLSHERRVGVVARLCAEGYSDRLVLSHDAGCYMDVIDGEDATDVLGEKTNWHYQFIIKKVVPDLLAAGVTRSQVDDMLVRNPRRFLESACKGGY